MTHTLHHSDGEVLVEAVAGGKHRITVTLTRAGIFMPTGACDTSYPLPLIELILDVKGPAYLCDEILRDESPGYVARSLHYDVLGYVDAEQFAGKRLLDFGCGGGASTMILGRMFPEAQIVGVELEPRLLEVARLRADHYGIQARTRLVLSPDGNTLPADIGEFDFVFLSAVYEHLLPQERDTVLPLLWRRLRPGGILFVNQTPYRWFPIESHTTSGLPFINYLPDAVASRYARRFSKRKLAGDDWPALLRKGIRGGSVGEILTVLRKHGCRPALLAPGRLGLTDRIDLWYVLSSKARRPAMKRCLSYVFKLAKILTGGIFVPGLSLAIRKPEDQ